MTQLALLPPLVLVAYLTIFAHELGHALVARQIGYRVSACGLGLGRPLLRLSLGGTVYYLSWRRPFQGLTFSLPLSSSVSRQAEVALLSGGLLAHALIVLCCLLALAFELPAGLTSALELVLWVNIAFLAVNAIPVRFRVGHSMIESDVQRILKLLPRRPSAPKPEGGKPRRKRARQRSLTATRTLYAQCVDHLDAIGDRTGAASYRAELALLELDCGQQAAAARLLEPAPPADYPAYLSGRDLLARAWLASTCPETSDQARPLLDRAAAAFAEDGGGQAMVELTRLELRLEQAQPEALPPLRAELGEWLREEPSGWVAISLRRLLLRAALRAGDHDAARQQVDALSSPSWLVPYVAGHALEAAGDPQGARGKYLDAARELMPELQSLERAEDRRAYLGEQEDLLARIEAVGGGEALETLLATGPEGLPPTESHLGVLAIWFVGLGAALDLALWSLAHLAWGDIATLHRLAVIAGTVSIAGAGAATMALASRDRKRLATLALILAIPVSLQALVMLQYYTLKLGQQRRAIEAPR